MKERDVVQKIRDWLVQHGALVFKMHGTIYSYKGHSDLYGCFHDGRAFFLEVKLPGKKPSPAQTAFLKLASEHGAIVGWCDSLEGARNILGAHVRGS